MFPDILIIILGVVLFATGSTQMQVESSMNYYGGLLTIGSLILNGIGILLILKYVSKMADEKVIAKSPSPPKFD